MAEPDLKKTFVLKGIGVSPGIVIGKAYVFDPLDSQVSYYKLQDRSLVAREIQRFKTAVKAAEKQLLEVKKKLGDIEGMDPLFIIDVHIMILQDKGFLDRTVANIRNMGVNAEWAVRLTLDKYKEAFEKIEDAYLQGRVSDVQYVGQRIIRNLAGRKQTSIADIGARFIIIAYDLSPADTALMKLDKVQGFATEIGGRTSHTAIVARSIEIPAVVGLENVTHRIRTNDDIIIDGSAGLVIVHPDPEVLKRYQEKQKHYIAAQEDYLKYAGLPAVTRDGRRLQIGANVEFIEEIPSAIAHGAEEIGLYRTEFIYINRDTLPTEEDHYKAYKQIVSFKELGWSTIRTFDLGGDKFFSDPHVAKEMNPQMGLRAIRFCLKEVDLFKTQIRGILRAAAHGRTRILFPMISGLEEIREAKRIFYEQRDDLLAKGVPVGENVEIGIMIEVPSAAVVADDLAKEVDFFSIGTNDLIQYALAIDRINEQVTYLYQPLHPAVLRLVKRVIDAGHKAGIPVAMCGEMAAEPMYTMILVGLQLDELSMNHLAIPKVKKIIQGTTVTESAKLLKKVLSLDSATEIRRYVESYMEDHFPTEFQSNGP
ncbi:MAG TPA: phosphoenolpyruvate--protein phosphotransferase [Syntrophales bacterium]|nr:phosphoenolpyruvate--protein phosphotransferase [Syntrophales bacterium]